MLKADVIETIDPLYIIGGGLLLFCVMVFSYRIGHDPLVRLFEKFIGKRPTRHMRQCMNEIRRLRSNFQFDTGDKNALLHYGEIEELMEKGGLTRQDFEPNWPTMKELLAEASASEARYWSKNLHLSQKYAKQLKEQFHSQPA